MALLGKILRRSPSDLLMAAEALVLLAAFRVGLAVLPVRKIIGVLARPESVRHSPSGENNVIARRVQWAVSAVARRSVVEFVCFPQALAGYTMLRRRGVQSTLVYGVARSAKGELLAHTWLTVGGEIVLGVEAASDFTALERWT